MWFFRHFWIFISYHIFLLNQVEGAIAKPPSISAPLPLFCPSVCPSVCPSIGLLTTFSGFCTFADKSLGRNGIELEMQMFPDDLPLANIDADGYCCHFMRSSVRPTIHGLGFVYCIQSAWKKWLTIWHADVSRWLTFGGFFCFFFAFFFLRLGLGQRRAVVIIGRWLLPSPVDTGDICCHYWQHILVLNYGVLNVLSMRFTWYTVTIERGTAGMINTTFHLDRLTRDPSPKEFMSSWFKSCYDIFWFYFKTYDLIRSQFCSCPNSKAVGTCAKLWPDWIIKIKIKAKMYLRYLGYNFIKGLWDGCEASFTFLCEVYNRGSGRGLYVGHTGHSAGSLTIHWSRYVNKSSPPSMRVGKVFLCFVFLNISTSENVFQLYHKLYLQTTISDTLPWTETFKF